MPHYHGHLKKLKQDDLIFPYFHLAKEMHTNTNYLSKIINTYKTASFSNYLKMFRIIYIVQELNVNNKYSKYTIQALAQVAGFNASESFG